MINTYVGGSMTLGGHVVFSLNKLYHICKSWFRK